MLVTVVKSEGGNNGCNSANERFVVLELVSCKGGISCGIGIKEGERVNDGGNICVDRFRCVIGNRPYYIIHLSAAMRCHNCFSNGFI